MPPTIEIDVKDVLAQINQKLDGISRDIADIRQKDLVELKVGQARLEEKVSGLEKRLEEKVDSLDKRLANVEFPIRMIFGSLIAAVVLGALGWVLKLLGFGFGGNA